MKKVTIVIVLFFSVIATTQAQTKSVPNQETEKAADEDKSLIKDYFSQIMGVALSTTSNVKLFQFVYDWIGTPYRFGGSSKNGVDCSAFTKELYSKVFNMDIKRSSRDIFTMVSPVKKEDLKEGDIVFFKIHSSQITHVGVYLGNNRFVQSANGGVKISNLDDDYYSHYFFKGGRLLDSFKKELSKTDDQPATPKSK
jgi:murein DD-endopeptidase / murein LD-carboxypeptidase